LPNSLDYLICDNNNLTSLPELPNSLEKLICRNNNLNSLPELPNSLKNLYCNKNNLPFQDLDGYKKWYKENKYIIKTDGLEYVYELYYQQKKYNL
jgi:Leucine-rich repeat (LRR) protein